MTNSKAQALKEFQQIPGVGKSIANDLWELGFRSVQDLKYNNPEEMYERYCSLVGTTVDRCLLYVFRCAVYFASNKKHEPELLKWWNWKYDQKLL
ncbi:MAG: pathogenicity locus [Ignavibacteria bacterium]|nr:pathogenicity locus [Ignavibacteria bacterium]